MYQNFTPSMNQFNNRCYYSTSECPSNLKLTRAYVLDQPYSNLLPLNVALKNGTIFSNIDVKYSKY